MALFQVDRSSCNRDGACAAVCPAHIIAIQEAGYPGPVPGAEQICIRCGHCVAVCPTASLDHQVMAAASCPPVQPELALSEHHIEHFLRSRRSIRNYKSKPVSREVLRRLIAIARYAPTGRNSQDVRWLVMGNRDEIRNAAALVVDWMRRIIDRDPQMAALMHLDKTVSAWERGMEIIFRDAPVLIVAHAEADNPRGQTNSTIALTYLELAALGFGLGTCWAGYFMRAAGEYAPLMAALKLPEGHRCFGAMMVGYPRHTYHRLPLRKEPKISWRL